MEVTDPSILISELLNRLLARTMSALKVGKAAEGVDL